MSGQSSHYSFEDSRDRFIAIPAAASDSLQAHLHHQTRILEDRQQRWSPFNLSSSSVSTQYASGSPDGFIGFQHGFELARDLGSFPDSSSYSGINYSPFPRRILQAHLHLSGDTINEMLLGERMLWGEGMPWSEPRR
jgi:hypothetical protein